MLALPTRCRKVNAVQSELQPGTPRSAVYDMLRRHHLVAYNPNYARYLATGPTLALISHSDEWPEPGQAIHYTIWDGQVFIGGLYPAEQPTDTRHPFVKIKFNVGSSGTFCEKDSYLKLLFDHNDRLASVKKSGPLEDCSSP